MYVPVLKGKGGEYAALAGLKQPTAQAITPLIELQPVPPPPRPTAKNPKPRPRPLGQHLTKNFTRSILQNWGSRQPVWIDLAEADAMRAVGGVSAVAYTLDDARAVGVQAVQVVTLQASAAFLGDVAQTIAADRRGVVLRLRGSDFTNLRTLQTDIAAMLGALGVGERSTDLVLDLVTVAAPAAVQAITAATFINLIANVRRFRSLTLTQTAFPDSLSQLPYNSSTLIERSDWAAWQLLVTGGTARRKPQYGDYGPSGAGAAVPYRGTPNIRYTLDNHWLVLRGGTTRTSGSVGTQHYSLAKKLRRDSRWMGRAFSSGDEYIHLCRPGTGGPGGATQWRTVAVNHHLEVVATQTATPGGSAGGGAPAP